MFGFRSSVFLALKVVGVEGFRGYGSQGFGRFRGVSGSEFKC